MRTRSGKATRCSSTARPSRAGTATRVCGRVEDGAIVGSSDGHTIEQNTFLILDRPFSDFVLRLELKLRNGNSGIQFRSKVFADWVVKGYQADASDAGDRSAWGNFYEEKGRGRNRDEHAHGRLAQG